MWLMGVVISFILVHMWIFSPFLYVSFSLLLLFIFLLSVLPLFFLLPLSLCFLFISVFCWRSLILCLIADSLWCFDLPYETDKGHGCVYVCVCTLVSICMARIYALFSPSLMSFCGFTIVWTADPIAFSITDLCRTKTPPITNEWLTGLTIDHTPKHPCRQTLSTKVQFYSQSKQLQIKSVHRFSGHW